MAIKEVSYLEISLTLVCLLLEYLAIFTVNPIMITIAVDVNVK